MGPWVTFGCMADAVVGALIIPSSGLMILVLPQYHILRALNMILVVLQAFLFKKEAKL